MKKLLSLVIAIVLMLTVTVSATAADFVESITNKGAPELVVVDYVDGKPVVGHVVDADGNELSTELIECLNITSIAEAETDPDITDEAKETLLAAYEELKNSGANLSDICPDLDTVVKEKWDKNKTANDLVVKDLFDISDLCDDINTYLPQHGATLDLTFDLGIGAGIFVAAMVYVDGKWEPVVDAINNGDGTVTVSFDKLCPVAFLVPGSGANLSVVSPTTSDASNIVIWGFVMLMSLVAIVALVIYRRKLND